MVHIAWESSRMKMIKLHFWEVFYITPSPHMPSFSSCEKLVFSYMFYVELPTSSACTFISALGD